MRRVIGGLVLAGGRSTRMGRSKALMPFAGRTLLEHTTGRLERQLECVIISSNDDLPPQARWPVVPDLHDGYAGPLAGIHAGLHWFQRHEKAVGHIAILPVDVPFFPESLVKDLSALVDTDARFAIARSNAGVQPLAGLWPLSILPALDQWLDRRQSARVNAFLEEKPVAYQDYPDIEFDTMHYDPFLNLNTPSEFSNAVRLWEMLGNE